MSKAGSRINQHTIADNIRKKKVDNLYRCDNVACSLTVEHLIKNPECAEKNMENQDSGSSIY